MVVAEVQVMQILVVDLLEQLILVVGVEVVHLVQYLHLVVMAVQV